MSFLFKQKCLNSLSLPLQKCCATLRAPASQFNAWKEKNKREKEEKKQFSLLPKFFIGESHLGHLDLST